MPTYQYACTNPECGNRFELVQSFTDPSASECPVCGSPVRKVYGSVGVVFKGSGFYRNDSRSGGGDSSLKPESSKSETKSDVKSDAKSESSTGKSDAKSGSSRTSTDSSSSSSAKSTSSSSSSGKSAAPA